MPIYDYACTRCGRVVEVVHGVNGQGPSACETCAGPMKKLLSSPAVHFKGSGWAKKDRGASNATKAAARASSGANAESKASGSSADSDGATTGRSTASEGSTSGASAGDSSTAASSPSSDQA